MKAAHTTTLILSLMVTPALAAKQEAAAGYYIDTSFTVRRSAEIKKDNGVGPLSKFIGRPMTVSDVAGKPDWRKITSDSGNYAYIHKDALVRVDVASNYRIRKDSPESKEKLGVTAKKNDKLLFTGQLKTTKEKDGQESKWLEVWADGKIGWVAAESSKLASEKAQARLANAVKPKPAAVAQTKAVETKTAPKVEAPAKASTATAKVADAPKPKPAAAAVPAPKPVPAVAAAEPVKPKPEEPKPAPKAPDRECVNTDSQFQSNERLRNVYGGPTPFTEWSGTYNIKIRPAGNQWELTIPEWVLDAKGLNPDLKKSNVALKICVNAANKPFINIFGKDYDFNGANEISIAHPSAPDQPIRFQRAAR